MKSPPEDFSIPGRAPPSRLLSVEGAIRLEEKPSSTTPRVTRRRWRVSPRRLTRDLDRKRADRADVRCQLDQLEFNVPTMTTLPAEPLTIAPRWSRMARFVFFFINFWLAVLLTLMSIVSVAVMENPSAFLGGITMLAPTGAYATAEWFGYYRNRTSLERPLGIVNLCAAGFVMFGLIANIGEALMSEEPPSTEFLVGFAVIGLAIAGYLTACGLFRLRRR